MLELSAHSVSCRDVDLILATCFNSGERTRDGWVKILGDADERFKIKGITTPEGSALSVIEVGWHG